MGKVIVDAAIQLHRDLGPGMLESVYEVFLVELLADKGLKAERQVSIPVTYRGKTVDTGFRVDLIVEGKVQVELKATESILPVHSRQALTYLQFTGLKLGYLLNFGGARMADGIQRLIMTHHANLTR